jgi:DNA polymerase I-like protein with 3'-5' exonuclease and polymerase domains
MSRWLRDAAIVDFETLPIVDRPRHPPVPVGVALQTPGQKPHYLAWGHPTGKNNCSWGEARRQLGEIYDSERPILFHNAKFDVEVAEVHLAMPRLDWRRYHDTLPALFLMDPDAPDYALKSSSERILKLPPDEQDVVVDWLVTHQPVRGVKLTRAKKSDNYAGAYLAYAPADIVGKYAIGDLDRTKKLAEVVFKDLEKRNMLGAYDRERELMLYVIGMEQQGIRINVGQLERDISMYERELGRLDDWMKTKLKASSDLNLDSGAQLAAALIKAGFCSEQDLGFTKSGKVQTNKDALTGAVKDKQFLALLKYRTQLGTCVKTFMKPWYEASSRSGGLIFTSWNSTRTDRSDGGSGTRTGRLSSSRIQNIPKQFSPLFYEWGADDKELSKEDRSLLPGLPYKLSRLPMVRSYIIPYEQDHCIIDRDYSQQELRALAHFEGGKLKQAYVANPWLDVHAMARELINAMLNSNFSRKPVKNTVFGLVYGMGAGKLADKNNTDVETAKKLKNALLQIFPGFKELYDEAKRRAKDNEPIRTWGGREYFCEPPRFDQEKRRWMEYDYKLPNRLIQGSAADITKEAMLRYLRAKPKNHRLILTVHDQLTASVPRCERDSGMQILREAMESIEMDVPMLSEGSWSEKNFQALIDYDNKGKRVAA